MCKSEPYIVNAQAGDQIVMSEEQPQLKPSIWWNLLLAILVLIPVVGLSLLLSNSPFSISEKSEIVQTSKHTSWDIYLLVYSAFTYVILLITAVAFARHRRQTLIPEVRLEHFNNALQSLCERRADPGTPAELRSFLCQNLYHPEISPLVLFLEKSTQKMNHIALWHPNSARLSEVINSQEFAQEVGWEKDHHLKPVTVETATNDRLYHALRTSNACELFRWAVTIDLPAARGILKFFLAGKQPPSKEELHIFEHLIHVVNDTTEVSAMTSDIPSIQAGLRESKLTFQNLYQILHDMVIIFPLDDDNNPLPLLDVNDMVCSTLGYPREELLTMTVVDLHSPDSRELLMDVTAESREKRFGSFESVFRTREGIDFPVEVNTARFEFNNRWTIIAVVKDLRLRREKESSQRRNEMLFRNMFDHSLDAIFILSGDSIVVANPSFQSLFSRLGREVPHSLEGLINFVSPHHQESLRRYLNDSPQPSRETYKSLSFPGEDDNNYYFDLVTSSLDQLNEETVLAILHDVTSEHNAIQERKRYFQARLAAEKKRTEAVLLAEKTSRLASVGVIAAGITHEINQPLNVIRLGADGIKMWAQKYLVEKPELVMELITDITEGVVRVSKIIDHMRSYWLAPSRELQEPVDLNECIRKALALTTTQMQMHFISLDLRLHDSPLPVLADGVQLEQIVNNLVINAIHALDEEDRPDKCIRVETENGKEKVILRIIDNGPGFPESLAPEELFDPFYSTKSPGKGTGLGLAIVRMFVDRFEGKITVDHVQPHGAQFTVQLPLFQAGKMP